jgi:hypothetical protein
MYDIDLNTASMDDVITRSYACYPVLFAETMISVAKVHTDYSCTTYDKPGARIASGMASNLRRMADDIRTGDFNPASLAFGERIQAFSEACKLQRIPHHVSQTIAGRYSA